MRCVASSHTHLSNLPALSRSAPHPHQDFKKELASCLPRRRPHTSSPNRITTPPPPNSDQHTRTLPSIPPSWPPAPSTQHSSPTIHTLITGLRYRSASRQGHHEYTLPAACCLLRADMIGTNKSTKPDLTLNCTRRPALAFFWSKSGKVATVTVASFCVC